jgi:para-aminobenzoate synthetase component 1
MPEIHSSASETKPREINPLGLLHSLGQAGIEPLCLLHSGGHPDPHGTYDWVLAWGIGSKDLGWRLGYWPYHAQPEPGVFPKESFFSPAGVLAQLRQTGEVMAWGEPAPVPIQPAGRGQLNAMFTPRWSPVEYQAKFNALLHHLQRGDIYEANLCMPLESTSQVEDPIAVFNRLLESNQAPFSAFFQQDGRTLISASPERFLQKRGQRILAQPMKGTLRKGPDSKPEDLAQSEKERAENVMIVDLIRHDLSQGAAKGTVQVEELFGVYSYGPVYQMISTVTAQLKPGLHPLQPVCDAFPPGSMTGAPKRSAISILAALEAFERGPYSGILGYMSPDGDFDFSVIIRTLECTAAGSRLCVGSAVTVHTGALAEYEECLLKADSILKPLNAQRVYG